MTFAACGGKEEAVPELTPEVDALFGEAEEEEGFDGGAIAAERGPHGSIIVSGLVDAVRHDSLYFDVPGKVMRVAVAAGDRVRRGQTLAELDTSKLRSDLREAQGRLRAARAKVPASRRSGRRNQPPPDYLVRELRRQQAESARTPGEKAREVARIRSAFAEEGYRGAAQTAEALYHRTNRLPSRRTLKRAADERLARALVDDLEQRVRQLRYLLDESKLRAPFSGQVHLVGVKPGDPWSPRTSEPAVELLDDSDLALRVLVPRSAAEKLRLRQRLPVELPATGDGEPIRLVQGLVQEVDWEEVPLADGEGGEIVPHLRVSLVLPRGLEDRLSIGEELRIAFRP